MPFPGKIHTLPRNLSQNNSAGPLPVGSGGKPLKENPGLRPFPGKNLGAQYLSIFEVPLVHQSVRGFTGQSGDKEFAWGTCWQADFLFDVTLSIDITKC